MTWFQRLTGIDEESPAQVREQLSVDGDCIVCPGGKRIAFGRLELPKLSELRRTVADLHAESRPSTLRELVGNTGGRLWKMQNGYLFPSDEGLAEVAKPPSIKALPVCLSADDLINRGV